MATINAARSFFRSTTFLRTTSNFSKSTRSSCRRVLPNNALSRPFFRCPAELSACVETMRPFHTATASALMTSMLSMSCRIHCWIPDDK